MGKLMAAVLCVPLMATAVPSFGQNYGRQDQGRQDQYNRQDQGRRDQGRQDQYNRQDQGRRDQNGRDQYHRGNYQQFYNGAYEGGRGGDYYGQERRYDEYDRRYEDRREHNGIGPGQGALIGGAGGAVLGAIFGGGAKGAIIGGAAGAGIGAVLGEHNQNENREHRY